MHQQVKYFVYVSAPLALHFAVRFSSYFRNACALRFVLCGVSAKNGAMPCDPQKPMDFHVSQCLRGRRARRREDNRRENGTNNKRTKSDYTTSKLMFFGLPGAHLNDIAQNGLPELPREPPGSCRGPFREAQEGPKSRQERPKSCPEAVPERPWRALGADLAPKSPQEGSRKRFLPPRGSIVGSCEARFGLLPALFGERFPQRQSTGLITQIGALGALAQEPPTELPGLLHEWGRRQGRSL